MTWPPSWWARILRVPSAGLPAATRTSGSLDAVVDGVAHHVGERVLDRLDDRLVELGLLALGLHPDLLAAGGGEVAHDSGELRPHRADRLHAGLHDALLQLAR